MATRCIPNFLKALPKRRDKHRESRTNNDRPNDKGPDSH
jgi:hypothetical protein